MRADLQSATPHQPIFWFGEAPQPQLVAGANRLDSQLAAANLTELQVPLNAHIHPDGHAFLAVHAHHAPQPTSMPDAGVLTAASM